MYVLLTPAFPCLALLIGLKGNERGTGLTIDPHAPKTRAPILASSDIITKVRPDSVFHCDSCAFTKN